MNTTQIDLMMFCGTGDCRPYLHKPFSWNGFTYATDGKIAMRIPYVSGYHECKNDEVSPPKGIEGVFAKALGDNKGWQDIDMGLFTAKPRIAVCPDCSDGWQECDCCGHEKECPECNGIGDV